MLANRLVGSASGAIPSARRRVAQLPVRPLTIRHISAALAASVMTARQGSRVTGPAGVGTAAHGSPDPGLGGGIVRHVSDPNTGASGLNPER